MSLQETLQYPGTYVRLQIVRKLLLLKVNLPQQSVYTQKS